MIGVVAGLLGGLLAGFGLSVWLFRIYLRRHPLEVGAIDIAARTATVGAAPSASEAARDVAIPMDIVEQLIEHLGRLDVLERRESMRVVRRNARPPSIRQ